MGFKARFVDKDGVHKSAKLRRILPPAAEYSAVRRTSTSHGGSFILLLVTSQLHCVHVEFNEPTRKDVVTVLAVRLPNPQYTGPGTPWQNTNVTAIVVPAVDETTPQILVLKGTSIVTDDDVRDCKNAAQKLSQAPSSSGMDVSL